MTKKILVNLPMAVACCHPAEDPDEGIEFVQMDIEVSDIQVPSYTAKCPKCGREILIDFNPL